jgi:phosphoribosylglycinamide formyltransferase 1
VTTDEAALRIAVMVSGHGRGTNLQALLDACANGELPARIAVVIGTKADAPAMDRARNADVPAVVVSPRKYEEDEAGYAAALLRVLGKYEVGLICLAGYMRILPLEVVTQFHRRILNVHPALLPFFGGKGMYGEHVHRAVLESGMKVTGCTVHFADEQYDTGPIVLQRCVPVQDGDTPEALAARVLPVEHAAYVEAIRLFVEGRLATEGRAVRTKPAEEADGA